MSLKNKHPELLVVIKEALRHALDNGHDLNKMPVAAVAIDMVDCCADLEDIPLSLIEDVLTELRQEKMS